MADRSTARVENEKLLKKLGGSSIDYKAYYGKYDTKTLTDAANSAVTDAYNAVNGVPKCPSSGSIRRHPWQPFEQRLQSTRPDQSNPPHS